MHKKRTIKLNLTDSERKMLRDKKVKVGEIPNYAPDELEVLLEVADERAREIYALADFQQIPSIGIKFAEDLIFMNYYSVEELRGKEGGRLLEEYEQKQGFWTDPCVEDQFRLAVYFANTRDFSKNWWDFTKDRKEYRLKNGYPADRPTLAWHEL